MTDTNNVRRDQAALLGLGGGALLAGALRGRGALPKPEEIASSVCVLGAALRAYLRDRQRGAGAVSGPLAAGMACGLLGDLAMGRLLPLPAQAYVPAGMLAFGAGHAAYLRAFRALARRRGLGAPAPMAAALAAYQLFAALGWQRWVRNDEQAALSYAALAYGALLAAMAGGGAGLALQDARLAPLAAGGALFVVSDLVLGARLLRGLSFPGRDNLIWLTYIAGQALIVWAASEPDFQQSAG